MTQPTVAVYDPRDSSIVNVPADQVQPLLDAGYKVGKAAENASFAEGYGGTLASVLLGGARGLSAGLSDVALGALPQNLKDAAYAAEDAHPFVGAAGEIGGSLIPYSKLALGARLAFGTVSGLAHATVAADKNNAPLTAENLAIGGLTGLFVNSVGEAAGAVLRKAAPLALRGAHNVLDRVAPTFRRVTKPFAKAEFEAAWKAGGEGAVSAEAAAAEAAVPARAAEASIPPLPSEAPPVDLTKIDPATEKLWRHAEKWDNHAAAVDKHLNPQEFNAELYAQDRHMHEITGMTPGSDPALMPKEGWVPSEADIEHYSGENPYRQMLHNKDLAAADAMERPAAPAAAEAPAPTLETPPPAAPPAKTKEAALAEAKAQWGKENFHYRDPVGNRSWARDAKTLGAGGLGSAIGHGMDLVESAGPLSAFLTPKLAAGVFTAKMARHGLRHALNNERELSAVINTKVQPFMEKTGKVVQRLIAGTSGPISSFLTGDIHRDYAAVNEAINKVAARPEEIDSHFSNEYGDVLRDNPDLHQQIVKTATQNVMYLQGQLPQSHAEPSLQNPNYDPPRSEKVRIVRLFKAIVDPHQALENPDMHTAATVTQLYPHTTKMVRDQLTSHIIDPRYKANFTPAQARRLSIILGVPVVPSVSPGYIARTAAVDPSTANEANAAPQQRPKPLKTLPRNFANVIAPGSQQHEVENTQ